jgi:antirestriction protein ArdC
VNNLVSKVIDRLVAEIEAGRNPWRKSWKQRGGGLPLNAVTRKTYKGINAPLLWLEQDDRQFTSNRWATFKQWGGAGLHVRKGEKGTPIIFWKVLEKGEGEDKSRFPMMRVSWVFNEAQLDGAKAQPPAAEPTPGERHAAAAEWFRGLGVTMVQGAPSYLPTFDNIRMPPPADFTDLDEYWSTLFHETVHWTGHKSRLARPMPAITMDRAGYALEELVAEIGAALISAHFGIDTEKNNAAYLRGWLQHTPDKRLAILSASTMAAKAYDFVTVPQQMEQAA